EELIDGIEQAKISMIDRPFGKKNDDSPTPKKRQDRRLKQTTTGAKSETWQPGDKASNKKWGIGTVANVQGTGEAMELDIAFPAPTGVKRLLAKFAPITKQ